MTPHKKLLSAIALTLAAAMAVTAGWWVWNRYFSERANPSAEEYPLRGIDISAHNGIIDFNALAAAKTVDFAYVKATEGTDFQDRNFVRNACGLKRAGIPAGAYHFFRFDTDGEMQALNFLHAIKGREFELPPAIDLEEWSNPEGFTTHQIMTELRLMLDFLRKDGIEPVIYTNKDGYHRFVKEHMPDCRLWICSFTDPPVPDSDNWDIWQYSHRGSAPGMDGMVDFNTLRPGSQVSLLVDSIKNFRQNSTKFE